MCVIEQQRRKLNFTRGKMQDAQHGVHGLRVKMQSWQSWQSSSDTASSSHYDDVCQQCSASIAQSALISRKTWNHSDSYSLTHEDIPEHRDLNGS